MTKEPLPKWVEPTVTQWTTLPKPRKKYTGVRNRRISPWVPFLMARKPGDYFETDYFSGQMVRQYANQLGMEVIVRNRRNIHNPRSDAMVWIISATDKRDWCERKFKDIALNI